MRILGIGVDILHAPRIIALVGRRGEARFARRILSDTELSVWNEIPATCGERRMRYLAVRWSVKESAYKALFPAAIPTWKDFTFHGLSADAKRKPFLEYHPAVRSSDADWNFHASVSHDGDYVFTNVVVEAS